MLRILVSDAELENQWLDLLSQLEYVGCRKILKSVPYEAVTAEVLQHIAEEASHALLLKTLLKAGGAGERSWADNPLSSIGWRYFQTLDQAISALPDTEGLNYPAVSWAVECRVLTLYPLYLELTRNEQVKRVLARILGQERRHGGQFDEVRFPEGLKEKMLGIEGQLWREFTEDIEDLVAARAGEPAVVYERSAEPASLHSRRADAHYELELRATD